MRPSACLAIAVIAVAGYFAVQPAVAQEPRYQLVPDPDHNRAWKLDTTSGRVWLVYVNGSYEVKGTLAAPPVMP